MPILLAIESSCDDTSAAIMNNDRVLSNVIANQKIHEQYGGVVPELASRAHQQNIIPVIDAAIKKSGISKEEIDGIAFTRGPGLLGSLLVGVSFAKGFSQALGIPMVEVNHLDAHILSHFIKETDETLTPNFPFLCLLVSGGHTQIVKVLDYEKMEVIGQTIDDAAGETFDKAAKIMNLLYPGGPLIDKYAKEGNPNAFSFAKPQIPGFDFSFSGMKTSFLYFLRDQLQVNPNFIDENKADLCASIQHTIVSFLLKKLENAAEKTNISQIALAGGVSANSSLRKELQELGQRKGWSVFIPKMEYCTDNAAMIGVAGYFKYMKKQFSSLDLPPYTRGI